MTVTTDRSQYTAVVSYLRTVRPTVGFLGKMWRLVEFGAVLTPNQTSTSAEIIEERLAAELAQQQQVREAQVIITPKPIGLPLNLTNVRNGHYRVEHGSGDSLSVRISAWNHSRYVNIGTADGWLRIGMVQANGEVRAWREVTPFNVARTRKALLIVQAAQDAGESYLLELNYVFSVGEDRPGACVFCGQPIRTDESTTAGYGEWCGNLRGLPWGEHSVEVQELRARVAEYNERMGA